MNSRHRVMEKILAVQTNYPKAVVLVALGLAVLAVLYTVMSLEFQTNRADLVSSDLRLSHLSDQVNKFGDLDNFVVAIENRDKERTLTFLQALVARLEADRKNYAQVFYHIDPDYFRPWALLYLDAKDITTITERLREHRNFMVNLAGSPSLTSLFKEINKEMASQMMGRLFTGFLDEPETGTKDKPLNLDFLINVLQSLNKQLDGNAAANTPWESFLTPESYQDKVGGGYFWTENKRYLLLFVTPGKTDDGFAKAQGPLQALRKAIARTQTEVPGVPAGVTGQEALNMDEMSAAIQDMGLATAISLVALTLLLTLAWRGFRRPILAIIQIVIALAWTFGLTTLFIGHLNILSVSFTPLLLGLGIDYCIHWFARYQEEAETKAASRKEAICIVMFKLGPAILLSGLTAALSFFPLALTGFKGLAELGIISTIGMVMTTITTLGVLPPLALLLDKPRRRTKVGGVPDRVRPLFGLTNRRAWAILIPSGLVLVLAIWGGAGVAFDLNMLRLQSKHAESVLWAKKLIDDSKQTSMHGAVLARSLDEVKRKTAALAALGSVAEARSASSLLPRDQTSKVALLADIRPIIDGVKSFRHPDGAVDPAELDQALGRIRFKMVDPGQAGAIDRSLLGQMDQVRDLIDHIRQRISAPERAKVESALQSFQTKFFNQLDGMLDVLRRNAYASPMQPSDLPPSIRHLFVGPDNLYLIRVFPALDIWQPEMLARFVKDLRTVDPDAVGDPVRLYQFTQAFRDAIIHASIYGGVIIFVLLWIIFRRLQDTVMAMIPFFVGTAWTGGLMYLFHVDLNLANAIFLPLVFGAGVEYGIIIVQRWRQEGREAGTAMLPVSTAKGVIIAGLSTTVGFGSLIISDHQGIYSLGFLSMMGSLSVLAAAVVFLPALLQVVVGSAGGGVPIIPDCSEIQEVPDKNVSNFKSLSREEI
ncbi:MAG: MMPL family transporter [Deltaproteobacteria bacterium]|nr:MMPL family transporter [Deltaproteobacteria bacterium]